MQGPYELAFVLEIFIELSGLINGVCEEYLCKAKATSAKCAARRAGSNVPICLHM
jgi:hypothetical protein